MPHRISTIITDLDNTLWDWLDIWHRPFAAMLDQLVRRSGLPRHQLEAEIRAVHQQHGTSEYAFVVEELPSLRRLHPGEDPTEVYASAIAAYRNARDEALKLYPGVYETLLSLRNKGCLLVAYTESMAFYTNYRLRKTGVDQLLDVLYSPADHELPRDRNEIRTRPPAHYELRRTIHRHTPPGELKPNPDVLRTILADLQVDAGESLYVGDSKEKDVAMAQAVGVLDVWAAYGPPQRREAYEQLRRVSHWPDRDVEAEKRTLALDVVKQTVSISSFSELLAVAEFVPHSRPWTQ